MQDIVIRGLCKAFDGKQVLRDFSAALPAGQVTGLMAPSGAGKTTLLRILMGLETPDRGTITGLEGLRLSAVFQEDRLCENLDPVSNLRLVTPTLSRAAAEEALKAVGLTDCLHQPTRELSGGMRRRVAILRALLASPLRGWIGRLRRLSWRTHAAGVMEGQCCSSPTTRRNWRLWVLCSGWN